MTSLLISWCSLSLCSGRISLFSIFQHIRHALAVGPLLMLFPLPEHSSPDTHLATSVTPPSLCSNHVFSTGPTLIMYLILQPALPYPNPRSLYSTFFPHSSYHLLTYYIEFTYSLHTVYCLYLFGRMSAPQDKHLFLLFSVAYTRQLNHSWHRAGNQ